MGENCDGMVLCQDFDAVRISFHSDVALQILRYVSQKVSVDQNRIIVCINDLSRFDIVEYVFCAFKEGGLRRDFDPEIAYDRAVEVPCGYRIDDPCGAAAHRIAHLPVYVRAYLYCTNATSPPDLSGPGLHPESPCAGPCSIPFATRFVMHFSYITITDCFNDV